MLVCLIDNEVKFKSVPKCFQLFSQYNILFPFIGEQQDHLNGLILHVGDFHNRLIARCDSTATCNKEDFVYLVGLTIDGDVARLQVVETAEWALNVQLGAYWQGLDVLGQFTALREAWAGTVDLEQHVYCFVLGTWGNRSVLSHHCLSLGMLYRFHYFNYSEVLSNFQLEGLADEFKLVNVTVMINSCFFNDLEFGLNRFIYVHRISNLKYFYAELYYKKRRDKIS